MTTLFEQLTATATDAFGRVAESAIDSGVRRAETAIDDVVGGSEPIRRITGPATDQETKAVNQDLATGEPVIIPSTGVSQQSPNSAAGKAVAEGNGMQRMLLIGAAVIGGAFLLPKLFGGK